MRLLSIDVGPSRAPVVAVEVAGRVLTAGRLGLDPDLAMAEVVDLSTGVCVALSAASAAAAERFATEGVPIGELVLAAPVPAGQVVAVGRNYHDHAAEQHVAPPEVPLLFAKLPSSVIGCGADIVWDPLVATEVDYEAELGVVIGAVTRGVTVDAALDSVFGYCNVNDVTARDLQRTEGQWLRGKSHDTFCPIGPVVVTRDEVPDPHDLTVTCTVNGELRQSAATADMIFGVAELIAHISRAITLLPGDVICTGTPGGVGAHRIPPALLADGDEVVVEVSGLGRLVNRCRTAPRV